MIAPTFHSIESRRGEGIEPFISVVVPVFNGAGTLSECLESLAVQDLDSCLFEVIIVDDGSTDDSYSVAKACAGRFMNVTCARLQSNTGAAAAMNAGVHIARGEWIAIIDADAVAPPNWLSLAMTRFHIADIVAGGFVWPSRSSFERAAYELMRAPAGKKLYLSPADGAPHIAGTNFFFKRKVASDVDGFDQDIRATYDSLFVCKAIELGYTLLFDPEITVKHPVPRNWGEFMKRLRLSRWRLVAVRKSPLMRRAETPNLALVTVTVLVIPALLVITAVANVIPVTLTIMLGFGLVFVGRISQLVARRALTLQSAFLATILEGVTFLNYAFTILIRKPPGKHWK